MGAKLFAWLGGLAGALAVAFFVKYSFEHDLIPPEVRVALVTWSAMAQPLVAFGFAALFLSYPSIASRPGSLLLNSQPRPLHRSAERKSLTRAREVFAAHPADEVQLG